MVRATLDGTKTQTRRTSGLDRVNEDPSSEFVRIQQYSDGTLRAVFESSNGDLGSIKCPYGKPGDQMWVRETWCPDFEPYQFRYRADGSSKVGRWHPSIHMPRWASRINLEVVSVRVERLQDISDDDAYAEGAGDELDENYSAAEHALLGGCPLQAGSPARHSFACLWESINGPGSWEANPWVWVVDFKRIKP